MLVFHFIWKVHREQLKKWRKWVTLTSRSLQWPKMNQAASVQLPGHIRPPLCNFLHCQVFCKQWLLFLKMVRFWSESRSNRIRHLPGEIIVTCCFYGFNTRDSINLLYLSQMSSFVKTHVFLDIRHIQWMKRIKPWLKQRVLDILFSLIK